MLTATAAVVESTDAPFTLQSIEVDEPRRDEVLVRVTATGICHTDLGARGGGIPSHLPGCWATKVRGSSSVSAPMSRTSLPGTTS